jgi:pilus assembly protein CpaB
MNRSRLLMIGGLALAVGLLVSFTVFNKLKMLTAAGNEGVVQVLVAANDIDAGSKLKESDVRPVAIPKSSVPPGAFTRVESLRDRGVILPIGRGDFILTSKLAAANAGSGLPSMIPQGMRAVSVRVNDVVSVAGFVQPGTRVDVLSTGNSGTERQTTTVLENVAVIAVGKNLDRNAPPDAVPAPVITLLVSPDDAQKLALASQESRIQLALRNPLDTQKGSVAATRASSLYPGVAAPKDTDSKPKIHKTIMKVAPPAPPAPYQIEMIRGSKRDETKIKED